MSVTAQDLPRTSTTTSELPPFLDEAFRKAVERAIALSRQEHTPYPGNRVAPIPRSHQRARGLANQMVGSFAPYAEETRRLANQAQSPFHYQEYMAPYENSVVNEVGRLGRRNFNEALMPEISNRFLKPTRGRSRHEGLRESINHDMAREFQTHHEDAMSRGHPLALQAFDLDRTRALEAADLTRKLGLADQDAQFADIESLYKVGDSSRAHDQALLDLEYELWKEEQRHEHDRLEELFKFLAHVPGLASSFSKTETHPPSSTMHGSDWRSLAEGAAMNIAGSLLSGGSAPAPVPTPAPTNPLTRLQQARLRYGY
jgi:hypothetical protein